MSLNEFVTDAYELSFPVEISSNQSFRQRHGMWGDHAPDHAQEEYREKKRNSLNEDIGEIIPVRYNKSNKSFQPRFFSQATDFEGMPYDDSKTDKEGDSDFSEDRNKGTRVHNLKAAMQGQKFTIKFTDKFKEALANARDRFGGTRGRNRMPES